MSRVFSFLVLIVLCFLSVIVPITSCNSSHWVDLQNVPLEVPHCVGYALARGCIAVFDMEKAEVVGVLNVCTEDEYVGDFVVAPNGNILIPIGKKGLRTSNLIRVIAPSSGAVISEFEVSRGPQRIYCIPGGLAIVEHPYLPSGSTDFACDVIEMNRMTLLRTLYFKGIAGEVLHNPEGRYFIGIGDVLEKYGGYTLVELDQQTGKAVGTPITLHTDFMFETAVFATASKIYAPMYPSEDHTVRPLAVLEFPSSKLLGTITTPFDFRHMVRVGQKVYVASFLGSTWKGALDVGRGIVSVVDVNTDQVVKVLDTSPGPQHMAYSETTGKLYVACVDGRISVIDTLTDEVTATIVCDDPRASGWGFIRIKVAS